MLRQAARSGLICVIAAAVIGTPCPVAAQDSPSAPPPAGGPAAALGERLFREGRALFEAGEIEPACKKFAESQRVDPALGTLLNLAECEARLGHTATAWARFRELAEKARRADQLDRQAYAEKQAADLEARLTYAVLRLPAGVEGLRIDVDGQSLEAASYTTALPLDPGKHRLDVTHGDDRFVIEFELAARPGRQDVTIVLDETTRVGGKPPSAGETTAVDGRLVAGWVLVGVAALGAGLGTYFGVRAMSLKDESDARCAGTLCDAAGLDAFEDARAHAHGATASFAIAGITAVVGTSLLVWVAVDGPPAATVSLTGRF